MSQGCHLMEVSGKQTEASDFCGYVSAGVETEEDIE